MDPNTKVKLFLIGYVVVGILLSYLFFKARARNIKKNEETDKRIIRAEDIFIENLLPTLTKEQVEQCFRFISEKVPIAWRGHWLIEVNDYLDEAIWKKKDK